MAEQLSPSVPAGSTVDAPTPGSRSQRTIGLVATAMLALAGLFTLRAFLPSIAWALVIAVAVWPLYQRLERRWGRRHRTLLTALVVLAVLAILVLPLMMIGFPVFQEAHEAAGWLDQAKATGIAPPAFLHTLPYGAELTNFWQTNLAKPGAISGLGGSAARGSVLEVGRRFGAAALHRLATVAFMLLVLFFVLRDADHVGEQLLIAVRRAVGPSGERVAAQVMRSVQGTVNGLVLVGLGEGLILGVAYWLAGVPHPALFGLLTALLAMVPFGAALPIAGAVLMLLIADHVVAAMVIGGLGLAVTFIADHFVRPVLIGSATRLPFLWVLLGILGGVETWGLVGLFVGPALLSALLLLWREFVAARPGPLNPTPEEISPTA